VFTRLDEMLAGACDDRTAHLLLWITMSRKWSPHGNPRMLNQSKKYGISEELQIGVDLHRGARLPRPMHGFGAECEGIWVDVLWNGGPSAGQVYSSIEDRQMLIYGCLGIVHVIGPEQGFTVRANERSVAICV
jgi:hypothetical protein